MKASIDESMSEQVGRKRPVCFLFFKNKSLKIKFVLRMCVSAFMRLTLPRVLMKIRLSLFTGNLGVSNHAKVWFVEEDRLNKKNLPIRFRVLILLKEVFLKIGVIHATDWRK